MKTVLIINHRIKECGVQQLGSRVYELIRNSPKINYIYREIDDINKYNEVMEQLNPEYIIYNWHIATMPWLTKQIINEHSRQKHYIIFHERGSLFEVYDKYLFLGGESVRNPTVPLEKSIFLPRPLLEYTGDYKVNDVFTVGSFGFGFWQKGFHNLTKIVNDTLKGSILNLHLPISYYADTAGTQTQAVIDKCRSQAKDITLNITQDFLTNDEILEFLAGNDINAFFYVEENSDGISSVIDYALSVKRPIIISNCEMFRHITRNDILIEESSIADVYKRGVKPLKELYKKWSIKNFRREMEDLFSNG